MTEREVPESPKKNFFIVIILALASVIATVIPTMYIKIVELYEDKGKQKDDRIHQLESDRDFWKDSYFNRPPVRSGDTAK